jgi:hypothetical protein
VVWSGGIEGPLDVRIPKVVVMVSGPEVELLVGTRLLLLLLLKPANCSVAIDDAMTGLTPREVDEVMLPECEAESAVEYA